MQFFAHLVEAGARTNDCVLTKPLRTEDTGKWQKVTVGETHSERGEDKVS